MDFSMDPASEARLRERLNNPSTPMRLYMAYRQVGYLLAENFLRALGAVKRNLKNLETNVYVF